MNRTGLFIALGLALVIGLLFGIFPELDLKLAGTAVLMELIELDGQAACGPVHSVFQV